MKFKGLLLLCLLGSLLIVSGGCAMLQNGAMSKARDSISKGKYSGALEQLSEAENYSKPTPILDAEITYLKGICYERMRKPRDAKAMFNLVVKKFPESEYGNLAKKKLEEQETRTEAARQEALKQEQVKIEAAQQEKLKQEQIAAEERRNRLAKFDAEQKAKDRVLESSAPPSPQSQPLALLSAGKINEESPKPEARALVASDDGRVRGIICYFPGWHFNPAGPQFSGLEQALEAHMKERFPWPNWSIFDKDADKQGQMIAKGYGTNENNIATIYHPNEELLDPRFTLYGVVTVSRSNEMPLITLKKCEFSGQPEIKRSSVIVKDTGLRALEINRKPLHFVNSATFTKEVASEAVRVRMEAGYAYPEWGLYSTSPVAGFYGELLAAGSVESKAGDVVYHAVKGGETSPQLRCYQSDGNGHLFPLVCNKCKNGSGQVQLKAQNEPSWRITSVDTKNIASDGPGTAKVLLFSANNKPKFLYLHLKFTSEPQLKNLQSFTVQTADNQRVRGAPTVTQSSPTEYVLVYDSAAFDGWALGADLFLCDDIGQRQPFTTK